MQLQVHEQSNNTLWVVWSLPLRSLPKINEGGTEAKGDEYQKLNPDKLITR